MTKINKLIMHGFKSFARRTELLFNNDFNCVVGPNGSGKSVSGRSKVLLANGEEIQIKELVESKLKKAAHVKTLNDGVYCESKEPINIISLNPHSMKSEEYTVSKFIKREGELHLYEIETRTGKKVRCTGCHPVMVFKNGKVVSSLVRNLNETDVIATPRIIHTSSLSKAKDFARLFGYIVGDGYITTNRIEFINKDNEIIEDFKELILKLFDCKPKYEKITNGNTRLIYREKTFVNKIVSLIKNKHNKYTTEYKYIPNNFLRKDINTISNLLAGLYDTDGTVDKTKNVVEFCSKNEKLANQIQRLLLRFGIIAIKKERMCCASNTSNKTKRKY
ncbi:MAG: LAGLIDADG family homing endonuclease [Nanoarchaeota archaeon]